MNKKELRAYIKSQKEKLSPDEVFMRSQRVLQRLYEQECYQNTQNIYTYVNYNQEVCTKELIEQSLVRMKNVFVPKVFGDRMLFYKISSLDELEPGAYGILEPAVKSLDLKDDRVEDTPCGLMIMPGLAFDRSGGRIGYGGGFYDRYLSEHSDFFKVALCFDFQIVDKIISEDFDIPVQMIISESEIISESRII
jgi:5-formyltetrahydrofolate cyclo-ligase